MPCTIIAGGQWGDEAKGKIASYLALDEKPDIVCRAGLGPGAGHTVCYENQTIKLRQIPSGVIARPRRILIGAGTLVKTGVILAECSHLKVEKQLGIDKRASLLDETHVARDKQNEHLVKVVGSTSSGHGPCLMDRAMRTGKLVEAEAELQPYLTDVALEVNTALDKGKGVHIEGTNGFLLSVLYGTYPHTVGKDSTASTAAADIGIGPRRVNDVILVFKTFPTRVGNGVFPTEMAEATAIARGFNEYGTVTGRRRRVGEFDFELAKAAVRINYPSQIALTFLDRIDPDCKGRKLEELSREAREFIDKVENALEVPVTLIGTGPGTLDIIDLRAAKL